MAKLISRKDFLKGTAAGALTFTASTMLSSFAAAEEPAAIYTPGTYTASEKGLESQVTVTMTFDETSITDVLIVVNVFNAYSTGVSKKIEGLVAKQPQP